MGIGEAGSITTGSPVANQPITVNFTDPLTDPVFAFTATSVGGDDITIRMVDQTVDADGNTTSFSFIIEEWEIHDGAHAAVETVNWLAIEEGVHTLADGRIIEAGTTDVSSTGQNTGTSQTFNADFDDPPVVLTSVMSNNDTITVDSDPSGITALGFNLTLQEEQAEDGIHGSETIGWIAIQAGGDATTGTASVSGNTVDHTVSTLGLGATFTDSVVLAETQTLNGPDTATVSIDGQTNSNVRVFIDEEESSDPETDHATEVVGIIAFEDGVIPCFTSETQIQMANGVVRVDDLVVGDTVLTVGNGLQPISWIGRRKYTFDQLACAPKLFPVRIKAGALGLGLPTRDLLVSRQHRILVRSKIAQRMFQQTEVLVAAINLINLPGVFIDDQVKEVEYFHLLFEQHELIYAEGTMTESLFTGPEALRSLSADARTELLCIFPELMQHDYSPAPAKYIPAGKQQKRLIERHLKNKKLVLFAAQ